MHLKPFIRFFQILLFIYLLGLWEINCNNPVEEPRITEPYIAPEPLKIKTRKSIIINQYKKDSTAILDDIIEDLVDERIDYSKD